MQEATVPTKERSSEEIARKRKSLLSLPVMSLLRADSKLKNTWTMPISRLPFSSPVIFTGTRTFIPSFVNCIKKDIIWDHIPISIYCIATGPNATVYS